MNGFGNLNRKRCVVHMALFLYAAMAPAQTPGFQQEVNYTITVGLNDTNHSLSGFEQIEYINRSSKSLGHIYFHLWPNAYKHRNTALGKQLVEHGNTSLYFADEKELGYIDSLDFTVNGKRAVCEPDRENPDICRLVLPEPLLPGETAIISTPFYVKIPEAKFSRLGHTGQAYYVTQWYPKPAVFDEDGWHPMPYLDQGEFYSEFGSFDVSITLPGNYELAATGDRVEAMEEEERIRRKLAVTKEFLRNYNDGHSKNPGDFPASSARYKTVRFIQKNVHDFAWFADKRFYLLHDSVQMPGSGRKVDTWVYFTPQNAGLWKDALNYVNAATLFYSEWVGEYPYDHVTAVDGTIMAGGGMEYPNITVIGETGRALDLELTIAHEVGHNWFYGILGSNERDDPFLDEGINSFYEMRYLRARYPRLMLSNIIGKDSSFRFFGLNKVPYWRLHELQYFMALRQGYDQPLNLKSTEYTEFGYGAIVYSKAPVVYDYLMDLVTAPVFDSAMHVYFERFKFRHPGPEDFIQVLSEVSGRDLHDISKQLIAGSEPTDYKIKSVRRGSDNKFVLKIKNKGKTTLPFSLHALRNDSLIANIRSDGFRGSRSYSLSASGATRFSIDGLNRMPDINRGNNSIRARGLFKKYRPIQFNFISKLEDPSRTQVNFIPVAGANYYNGFMAGISFHNYSLHARKFQYMLTPFIDQHGKFPMGFADIEYTLYPRKLFRQMSMGIKGKRFAYDKRSGDQDPDILNYLKIAPYLNLEVKNRSAVTPYRQFITFKHNALFTDSANLVHSAGGVYLSGKKTVSSYVNEIKYLFNHKRVIDPYSVSLGLQQTANMLKLSCTMHYDITITPDRTFSMRVFAGTFLSGTSEARNFYAFRASGYSGYQDYLFDHNFLARNERSGVGFSQFAEEDGAMKVWSALGQSPEWLCAVNIKSPGILKPVFRLYADAVICDARYLTTDFILWNAGLNLVVVKDIIDVYLPIVYSKSVSENLSLNNIAYFNRIRFTFNIHKLEPKNILKNSFF